MKKVVMFGAGQVGKRYFYNPNRKFEIVAVLDNNKDLIGRLFEETIPIISIKEYIEKYMSYEIVIALAHYSEVERQLQSLNIYNYKKAAELFNAPEVPIDEDICHDSWRIYLQKMFDREGMEILEIGSRDVTGKPLRDLFSKAHYTGFDYYSGENVDVVGDAHELSKYFDRKFDLIFSSAVFEHLAMPWKVSIEIIKLLKVKGYVFIETH